MFGGEQNIRVLTPEPLLVLPQNPKFHQSNKNVFWLLKSVFSSTESPGTQIGLVEKFQLACLDDFGVHVWRSMFRGACLEVDV